MEAALTADLPGARTRQRLGLAVMVLLWALTWALSHAYKGIFHDADLYTLQALARLHPGSLSHDVFLRFGSQDRYTLFSPVYAALIQLLGVETAAAVLTLSQQLALFLGALLLVRRVVPAAGAALLGVALFLAVPGTYGADTIFAYMEPFVTPRMGAEALVLGSLAAALCGRRSLACALLLPAVLLHPVMAAAGLAALLWLYVGIPRPGLAALLGGAGILLLTAASLTLPAGGLLSRFDAAWLALIQQRSAYLFLEHWSADDWIRTAVSLATLAIGWWVFPAGHAGAPLSGRARKLCQLTLLTAVSGLTLGLIACDGLQLVLLTQLQPWRWVWLATVVAALLLPAIAAACWNDERYGRPAATLLASAWVFASGSYALMAVLGALASLVVQPRLGRNETRLLFFGAGALLLIAITWRIASNLLFMDAFFSDTHIPAWLRDTASFAHDGFVPFAIAALASFLTTRPRGMPALCLLGTAAVAAGVALAPDTWTSWSERQFPPSVVAEFAGWRALVPPDADVFWSESPVATWVLLQRPSYLSVAQTSGMVFSRPAALEMQRRAGALRTAIPPESFLQFSGNGAGIGPSKEQLARVCATAEVPFVVTATHLGWPPAASVSGARWHAAGLRLYRCADRPG